MFFNSSIIYFILLFLMISCNYIKKEAGEKPIARVHDLYLYPSEIADQIPSGISSDDSLRIARSIISEWVKDKLLLKKAEQFLAGSDYNIGKQLEDYRASLLTFKYKQEVLSQKLDTVVKDNEIINYFMENSSNYLLNTDVVRLTYIKIQSTTPKLLRLKDLYKSEKDEDLAELEQYCIEHADKFIIQSPEWYRFWDFIQQTPFKNHPDGRDLLNKQNIESMDSSYHYFIHIIEHIPEKKIAPIEMVTGDIKSVLINKRRITLLQELEGSVYKDGMSRNLAEIY